jgi:hypothetical protein
MATVRVEAPETMNILGLFLARALRRNLEERAKRCRLRGAITIETEGMRASVRFEEGAAVVTREAVEARVRVTASMARLVDAIVRPGLLRYLHVGVKGNPIFGLRALRYFVP